MTRHEYRIELIRADGTRETARVVGAEYDDKDGVELRVEGDQGVNASASSERSLFDAFKKIRRELETQGILLHCCASEEMVYPSPMQESMGLNCLAYRNRLGYQALSSDIVNIFESKPKTSPVSVDRQEAFHQLWLDSLLKR